MAAKILEWEINMNTKQKADKIRLDILSLTDEELLNFAANIYGGDDIDGQPFEAVIEFVKRVSSDFSKNLPF